MDRCELQRAPLALVPSRITSSTSTSAHGQGACTILRPFVYLGRQPGRLWSQNSVPTLGIRNPHGFRSTFRSTFGTDF